MADTQEKHYLLIIAVLTSFAGPVMLSAVTIALPAMGKELSMNAVELSWIAQSFSLAMAVFVLPFGRLGDIWGRKKIFTLGLSIAVVSTLLSALATSFLMLISLRVLQGIGMSMLYSTSVAMLISSYLPAERGRVLGINVAAVYSGISLGPVIGGILTQNFGWRSIFFLFAALQLPALVLLLARVRTEWREAQGEKFDIAGALLFAAMLFCLMYGFSLLPAATGIGMIVIGIIGLAAFVAWERKAASPMFNIQLLTKNRMFAFSNLAQMLFYLAIFSIAIILSLYLQYVKGFSPQNAGLIILAQPVVQAALSPVAGRLSDRVQPRLIVTAGVATALVGLLILFAATATANTALLFIIVSLVLLGAGLAFFAAPNTNAIMGSVERKYYGVGSALEMATRNVGMAFSMGILMLLFSLYMGTAQITPEYYAAFVNSIRMALLIYAGFCVCGIVASAARGKVVSRQE